MKTLVNTLMVTFYIVVVTLCYIIPVYCERILAISPMAAQSHWNIMTGVLRALTDHGHHVTVFTTIPNGDRENYTEVDVSKDMKSFIGLDINEVREHFTTHTDLINNINIITRDTCKCVYENKIIQNMMTDPNSNFDVIVIEFLTSECVSYLSGKLNIPLIYVISPPIISYMEHSILGHYTNPAYVSHLLADHSVPRSFFERLTNTMLLLYTSCLNQYNFWLSNKFDQQPFDLAEPIKPSIVFSNAHYITDAPRPLPPNVIPIGGIHLSQPKTIPQDVLEFIESSPNGVIYFTLGSLVKISSLPKRTHDAIIDVLGNVPYRVLLKYEENMINIPKNIMTRKWFPQRDILMHPKIKLFISHGGISGVYEAVDAGVPILGFPVFFDQHRNLANVVDAGMAILMKLESVSKDTFKNAILELINNKKYHKNAKMVSELFKDRPMSPEKTVDYWTRYVIRHKGAPHMKSHALNLTWYQYLLLDVIAIVLFIVISTVYITYTVSRLLYNYFVLKIISTMKSKSE